MKSLNKERLPDAGRLTRKPSEEQDSEIFSKILLQEQMDGYTLLRLQVNSTCVPFSRGCALRGTWTKRWFSSRQ